MLGQVSVLAISQAKIWSSSDGPSWSTWYGETLYINLSWSISERPWNKVGRQDSLHYLDWVAWWNQQLVEVWKSVYPDFKSNLAPAFISPAWEDALGCARLIYSGSAPRNSALIAEHLVLLSTNSTATFYLDISQQLNSINPRILAASVLEDFWMT